MKTSLCKQHLAQTNGRMHNRPLSRSN